MRRQKDDDMAFAATNTASHAPISSWVATTLRTISERIERYNVYRTTVNELDSLSTRDLNDMGIGRHEIRSIALKAAYGEN